MAIVDERGRIAGRANVIDVAVAIIILVLIPVTYGAYLLFRTPAPKLLSIAPDRVHQGPNLRLEISGKNLRPFMRVAFNTIQGRTFMIGSTKYAQVDLPDLAPGTYDVQLYDYMQEVDRLPKALTILPLAPVPNVEMEVGGAFQGLPDAQAKAIKAGDKFPPAGGRLVAEVVRVGGTSPARLRLRAGDVLLGVPILGANELTATLRLSCFVATSSDGSAQCQVSGPQQAAVVAPGSLLTLAGPQGWVNFQISEVHLATTPVVAQAHVRFVAAAEVAARIKAGDIDSNPKVLSELHAATIVTLGGTRAVTAAEAGQQAPLGGSLRLVDATLRVPIEPSPGGWSYKEAPFKAGAPFDFETPQYVIHGEIADVTWPAPAAKTPPVQ